jgi:hypothetical protein
LLHFLTNLSSFILYVFIFYLNLLTVSLPTSAVCDSEQQQNNNIAIITGGVLKGIRIIIIVQHVEEIILVIFEASV